jgi:hypothetical protein
MNILWFCVIFTVVQTDVAGPMKDKRKGKYQEDFIKFGFTSIVMAMRGGNA